MITLQVDVLKYIRKTYKGEIEYPWMRYPDYGVVRHKDNQKWYALFMDIPRSKLGLPGDEAFPTRRKAAGAFSDPA